MRIAHAIACAALAACTPHMAGPAFRPAPSPPAGTGIVYVYRPAKARRAVADDFVAVDNRANIIPNGSVVAFALAPGEHEVMFGEGEPLFANDRVELVPGVHTSTLTVHVTAGGATYIHLVAGNPPEATIDDSAPNLSGLVYAPGGYPRYAAD